MSELYAFALLLHILSATVLFGTGLGTAFQMWMADRSGDVRAIAVVAANVVRADFVFTTPAVIIQPLTGALLIHIAGFDPKAPWLLVVYGLYALTGACWLPVVWIQLRIRDVATEAARSETRLPPVYRRMIRAWFWLGWPAFSAVLVIFWVMIVKPVLW
ncbi:MAG: DUF2269 domain-containing protein [Alphaproteobacteria bacterium]|nr:DUF2269 domain-containing protein [Alphaproteobacteria bacterium]MDE2266270.1 DUF2269 domain-containing protein [Alphaproteobacteria bacterium]MDE2499371.1 DUF2269 domain-containing protein [Alphaproteobacteria bacterium]